MMEENYLIPECYGDSLLVRFLGFQSPNHQHGIGEVANVMIKKFENKKVVGLIDNDKTFPSYFDEFVIIENHSKHRFQVKKHKKHNHYLVCISPAFEGWIEAAGNEVGLKRPYTDEKEYRKKCKSYHVSKDAKITAFLNNIRQKKSPSFLQLKKTVENLYKQK